MYPAAFNAHLKALRFIELKKARHSRSTITCVVYSGCVRDRDILDTKRPVRVGCDTGEAVLLYDSYDLAVKADITDPFVVQVSYLFRQYFSLRKNKGRQNSFVTVLSTPIGPSSAPICRRIIRYSSLLP